MPNHQEQQISIAVIESDGRFLIGRRAAGAVLAGLYEFPGGKVRSGEEPAAAAVRECIEETGLCVTVDSLIEEVRHQYAHGALRLFFFACCRVDSGCAVVRDPFFWVNARDLSKYEFPAANRSVVDHLLAAISVR